MFIVWRFSFSFLHHNIWLKMLALYQLIIIIWLHINFSQFVLSQTLLKGFHTVLDSSQCLYNVRLYLWRHIYRSVVFWLWRFWCFISLIFRRKLVQSYRLQFLLILIFIFKITIDLIGCLKQLFQCLFSLLLLKFT